MLSTDRTYITLPSRLQQSTEERRSELTDEWRRTKELVRWGGRVESEWGEGEWGESEWGRSKGGVWENAERGREIKMVSGERVSERNERMSESKGGKRKRVRKWVSESNKTAHNSLHSHVFAIDPKVCPGVLSCSITGQWSVMVGLDRLVVSESLTSYWASSK